MHEKETDYLQESTALSCIIQALDNSDRWLKGTERVGCTSPPAIIRGGLDLSMINFPRQRTVPVKIANILIE